MIKLRYSLRRRFGISPAEFHRYWRDVRGPRVHSHAEALKVARDVQVPTTGALHAALRHCNDGASRPFNGFAEVWVQALEDLRPLGDAARRASAELRVDEERFVDPAASPMTVGEERQSYP